MSLKIKLKITAEKKSYRVSKAIFAPFFGAGSGVASTRLAA